MSNRVQDELWPHFTSLWTDLRAIAPGLLLAGGYALFLKQQWLVSQLRFPGLEDAARTLIAIQRWRDQSPRVTKDFDFITSLDLIASEEHQQRIQEILNKHGFNVVPANARWQFAKQVGAGRSVVLDFHTPTPAGKRSDVRIQSRRVKPQPSLGQRGIHGRANQEAACAELHPFSFICDGPEIVLPNSVSLVLMKLVAMSDRRLASQDASLSAEARQVESLQARKHAEDVCRVMAMTTRGESESASDVLDAVRPCPAFAAASGAFSAFFKTDGDWGSQVVAKRWHADDFRLIQSTLAAWLS